LIKLSPISEYVSKGTCFESFGQYELAKEEYFKATKLEGNPEEAYYNLALIARAEMKFEEAKQYCIKSLKINPDNQETKICLKDVNDALKYAKKICLSKKKDDKDYWYNKAVEFEEKGKYSKALLAIEIYIRENPSDKYGKLLMTMIYNELGFSALSIDCLKNQTPNQQDAKKYTRLYHYYLGKAYRQIHNFKKALKCFDKVIATIPSKTEGYIFKGACLSGFGKYELAKVEFHKATQVVGNPEEAFFNLALIARAEMKFEEAKMYCEKAIEIDPEYEDAKNCLKDIDKAIILKKK
jgi:tetratricopeptide (TPR) repeat protein